MFRTILALALASSSVQASNDPCEWFRMVERNLYEMKVEGYTKRVVLEESFGEDPEYSTTDPEDEVLLREAIYRVFDDYSEKPDLCRSED